MPVVRRRLPGAFTEAQKRWQLLRRGRYIEFNLLYDRGVKVRRKTRGWHVAGRRAVGGRARYMEFESFIRGLKVRRDKRGHAPHAGDGVYG
jgi:hypothetical protein